MSFAFSPPPIPVLHRYPKTIFVGRLYSGWEHPNRRPSFSRNSSREKDSATQHLKTLENARAIMKPWRREYSEATPSPGKSTTVPAHYSPIGSRSSPKMKKIDPPSFLFAKIRKDSRSSTIGRAWGSGQLPAAQLY